MSTNAEIEALEWGAADDDGFFVLALVRSRPPLEVKLEFDRHDGALLLTTIEVMIVDVVPSSGMTANLYRSVPIGRMHALASTLLEEGRRPVRRSWPPQDEPLPPEHWLDPRSVKKRGRRPMSSLFLAQAADRYVHYVRAGHARPVVAVAEDLGVSASTVSSTYLPKARERGLLTSTKRGRAGGQLTDLARGLLAQAASEDHDDGER